MDKEQFLNILKSLNSYLDELRDSLTIVERNHPKQLSYLTQLHKSVKVNNCHKICYSVPVLGDCGDDGSGSGGGDGGSDATCAWISPSNFSRVIDSWMTSGFNDVMAVAYMDSLQQFNSTIDQIQSIKSDFFHPIEQANILSIDYSPWLDAIKAEAKQQFSNQPRSLKVTVTEDYSTQDMSAPQPIIDALNALSPYIGETVYYARVVADVMFAQTVENQYIVGIYPTIEFLSHDGTPLWLNGVTEVYQACFKGGNIAAFKQDQNFESPNFFKQPDSVLSSLEGTKWLKSQGGFTTIDCFIPLTGGGVILD